jgi:hypothetical protein
LIAGDTLETATGPSAKANLDHFVSFLEQLQIKGEINLVIDEIKGEQFNCNSLSEAISRVNNLSSNDALIFYYSGTEETIPGEECGDKSRSEKYLLGEVIRELRAGKSARFILTLVDNCNKLLPDPENLAVRRVTRIAADLSQDALRTAFQHLFLDYKGAVTMSGSSVGEPALCADRGNSAGGAFSNQFLGALYQRISSDGGSVDWKDITADAASRIEVRTNMGIFFQSPQFDVQIGKR